MRKHKTQPVGKRAGLQGVFNFEQPPFSPSSLNMQPSQLCAYRIDANCFVETVWRRNHV